MMLRDYIQKAARRILRLPKKTSLSPSNQTLPVRLPPSPAPASDSSVPRAEPPLRRPARAAPSEDDL
jgi:hypothetical protein